MDIPRPFSDEEPTFESYDRFIEASLPDPGPFLVDHTVLTGRDHAAFHRLAREVFEMRGVYDMTFGYNLARLNVDTRHPDAGFRYARDREDPSVLRASFTPTTEFCPQSDTLSIGAMRAFNGESHLHEYDLVRVRVDPMHNDAVQINGKLKRLESELSEGEERKSEGTAHQQS